MTYSIVARDPASGALGVAVQSHWFSVGSIVTWASAGVGAVATQAFGEPSYGQLGLELMAAGKGAAAALAALASIDDESDRRQVAMVDAQGGLAVHTGDRCIPEAGHVTAEGVTCQANMMRRDTVPAAMLAAYTSSDEDLPGRLLAALRAAEDDGGDIRGQQSAAMLVVAGTGTGRSYEDRLVDLRVDDHPRPLDELGRLLTLQGAYQRMGHADELLIEGDTAGASGEYRGAFEEAGLTETAFWHGVMLAEQGDIEGARRVFASAFSEHDGWAELLRRLPAVGLFPDDLVDRLLPD